MVHRAQDSRLLAQVLKVDKEYSSALNGLLLSSQASLAALNAYASSCPPNHAQAMLSVVSALSGADEALRAYLLAVDAWRTDLKRVRRSEEEIGTILRDREILVGKLVKASNKRSTRDNMALNAPFATEMSLGLSSHASGTSVTATATTGTSKLSHAQAELQACELHLAAKERELENIREETLKKGLERRLKALVSCGWAWGERGKQALRALDGLRGDHTSKGSDKNASHSRQDPNDSQVSSVTPSQSASQIALGITSDDSPVRPPTQPRRGSLSPLGKRANTLPESKPEPAFELEIGPAHSIDDHRNIHDSVPSSRVVHAAAAKAGSSNESVTKMPEEDDSFENTTITKDMGNRKPVKPRNENAPRTLRRPAPTDAKALLSPRIGFPSIGSGASSKQSKHTSDLGPRNTYDPLPSPREDRVNRQGTLSRKRSTSLSLLGGLTGMFKGRKRSSSAERNYIHMSTGGWHTRTDKNLAHSRERNSSSEDELPSTLMRKTRLADQKGENSSVASGSKRLIKRISIQPSSRSRVLNIQRTEGSKYTVVEQTPGAELVRRESDSRRAANLSTDSGGDTARETAANTASNSGTKPSRRASMPAERSTWDMTTHGKAIRNRLQHDDGTNGLNKLESRTAELSKLSDRLNRLEEMNALMDTPRGENSALLPPPQLEEVKAPPSIIQTPLLLYPTQSSSHTEGIPSPRASSFNPPASSELKSTGSPAQRPTRLGSLDAHAQPNEGSSLKPHASTSSRDWPLKSALKSPNRATAPHSAPPSTMVGHKRSHTLAGDTLQFPDRSGAISPPTPAGARNELRPNGGSLFVTATNISTPPTSPSVLVPTPRRLSEIPASIRSSVAVTDDGESIYESANEEFSGPQEEEKGSEGTETPPTTDNALSNILERIRPEEPRPLTPSRSTPVSVGEVSHESSQPNTLASSTSTSTQRRKSVRMILHPTAALPPPESYADGPPTPRAENFPTPLSSPNAGPSAVRLKSTASGTGSGGGGAPEAWETRIDSSQNAWDDSSEEDEEYGRAKRALARASDPYPGESRTRRA